MTATAPKFPLMAREFADFDQSTLPAIPAGFEDSSWHNDACLSFYSPALKLLLWIDYADEEQREAGGMPRFSLNRETRVDGIAVDGVAAGYQDDGHVFDGDEWADVLAHIETARRAAWIVGDEWADVLAHIETARRAAWIVGDVVEYSNGQTAVVMFADGLKAVLYAANDAAPFLPAHGSPDEWVIPTEDENGCSTYAAALAAINAV